MQLLIPSYTVWFCIHSQAAPATKLFRELSASNKSEKHNSMQVCWRS